MPRRLSAGLTMGLMLWTGAALAQGTPPPCDQQGKAKTPEKIAGEVTRIDTARGTITVREADGTVHELQASAETLRDVSVGGRVDAKLRAAPKCS
jgi:hypothetical protein